MKIVIMIVLTLYHVNISAKKKNVTGNDILSMCNTVVYLGNFKMKSINISRKGYGSAMYCIGMVSGLRTANALKGVDGMKWFCSPEGNITNEQYVRIIVKYLKDNPKDLHRSGTMLALLALTDAYPCRKKK